MFVPVPVAARAGHLSTTGLTDEAPASVPDIVEHDKYTPPEWYGDSAGQQHVRQNGFQRSRLIGEFIRLYALELDRGLLFYCLPVGLGMGAIIYFNLPSEPKIMALVSAMCLFSGCAWLCRNQKFLRAVMFLMLCLAAGLCAGKVETLLGPEPVTGSAINTTVFGTVRSSEKLASGRSRLIIDVEQTRRPQLRYQPARIRITTSLTTQAIPGSRFEGRVRLLPPPGPTSAGGYDFSFRSYYEQIGAVGFTLGKPVLREAKAAMSSAAFVEQVRAGLSQHIRERLPDIEGTIALALVTGKKNEIPDDIAEALRMSGLAHILSISGLHMALVAGTVAGTLRMIFALFPAFSSRWPVRKIAASAALLAVTMYLLISGASIATQRSYLMLVVMLLAMQFDRAAITMRNVAIAATLILMISPHEVLAPGFQMSFAATAGLVAAFSAWQERRTRHGTIPRKDLAGSLTGILITLFFTSLIAGAATSVFGAYHFQRIATIGPLANILAMPIVTFFVMPSAVAAHILMLFGLDGPLFALMGWGIGLVIEIAEMTAPYSQLDSVGSIPAMTVISVSIGLLFLTILTTRLRVLGVLPVLYGMVVLNERDRPLAYISEDGRALAVVKQDAIMMNGRRVDGFLAENWQRLAGVGTILPRAKGEETPDGRFSCNREKACFATMMTGDILVHVPDARTGLSWCNKASVIVVATAHEDQPCSSESSTKVLTLRHLARRGAVVLIKPKTGKGIQIKHAIGEELRPWHDHRKWSREARGLKPYGSR